MSARKGGLGRGLGALIPTAPVDAGYAAAVDSALFARAGAATAPRPERAVGPFGDLAPAVETVPSPEEPAVDTASSAGEAGGPVVVVPPASEPVQAAPVLLNGVPARLLEVPVASVVPNPKQPRQVFDEAALDELVASIREVGLLQPLLVRQTGEESFELVAGERRWRAIKAAGMDTVPVIVKDTPDDALLRDALLENLHREQLNPLEEAAAYAQLLEEFGATHEELARRIGRSRSQVTNTLRLLQLTPSVQRRLAAGVLTAGHARALLGLADPQAQESLAARIVAEGLSVRAVEEIVALGDEETPARATRTRRFVPPRYVELGDRLGSRLDTRVTVAPGTRKGKIVIEFGGDADLARIVDLLEGSLEDPHTGQADVA